MEIYVLGHDCTIRYVIKYLAITRLTYNAV